MKKTNESQDVRGVSLSVKTRKKLGKIAHMFGMSEHAISQYAIEKFIHDFDAGEVEYSEEKTVTRKLAEL